LNFQLHSQLKLNIQFKLRMELKIDVNFQAMGENRPTLESTPRKRKRNKGQGLKSRQASKPKQGGPQGGKGTTKNRTLHQSHGAYQPKTFYQASKT
jgi:hypothetical protein